MYDIRIPESLYKQASNAARAERVSVEEFVAETLQQRLQGDVLTLTPEQVAIVQKGQADIKAGNFFTTKQVKAELAANREAWLTAHPQ